ncbi:MAG TPA: immunoglobulin domain-containing protein, partial [Verrucomicrobiae bacterium]|nr:immunoglobulin domain-containing protein [Verrucomicrobiae bacterium]
LTQTLSTRAPRVVTHPQNVLVLTGATANFTFSATATMPYTNQWRLNGTNVPGATAPTLAVTNVVPGKDGEYTVLVGNAFGFDISHPARLEIGSRPRLVVEPVGQIALEGSPVTISVTVDGSLPMSYRWRQGSRYVHEYTTNSLVGFITFNSVHITNAGTYTVGVTNILGPASRLSLPAVLTVLADADRDRMADSWETLHGFDSENPSDAYLDTDGDGMENWKEYVAGTLPREAASYLNINRLTASLSQATVTFNAVSNRSYTVQFTDRLGASWSHLQTIPTRTTNRVVSVIDPAALDPARFYRLAIP